MASVLTSEQVTYLKSGEVFILHGCTGTLSKRYFAITNAFELKGWPSTDEFPLARRVSTIYNMERACLTFGQLGTGEFALNFSFPSPQVRSSSMFPCASNRNTLTLVVKTRDQLHSWVRAVTLLFAGLDHHPCREGTMGGDTCTICLSDFEDGEELSFLNCKHRFHTECINEWLNRSGFCPNCKNPNVKFDDGTLNLTTGRFYKRK
jgi:hypothetical protein|eukprot:g1227.t1